jgi:hypothetical protein
MVEKIRKAMRESFNMTKQRCYNPNCRDYSYYGGRGIGVCDRWRESFENFIEDMGFRPEGTTLERRDNNKDYSKENCFWASRKTQTRNRRLTLTLTVAGVTKSLAEWAEETGIDYYTLKARKQTLRYSDEDCLRKEVKCGGLLSGKVYEPRKSKIWPTGLEAYYTKLTPELVDQIGKARASGLSQAKACLLFKLSVPTIRKATQFYADKIKTNELQVPRELGT